MRAALYIRVSTDEQAEEGYSIEDQKRRLMAFADSQDWEISEVYIDDGYSAKDLKRPAIQELINDVPKNKFDIVLIYKLNRLIRSASDCDFLLKLFDRYDIKFQSCVESYETRTAAGRLFIRLMADIAQFERENIAENVRNGMEQMVHEGKRPGGPVPYGYDKDGKIIEEEAETIRLLRKLYMDGDGFKAIAHKLNTMGKFRRGYRWGVFSTWYVLDNPYYAGKIRWGSKKSNGKYASRKKEELVHCIIKDGTQDKIFTWEEYLEHTDRMKSKAFHGHSKKREYWFNGVLFCGKCGSRMSGRYHRNKRKDGSFNHIHSYICVNRQDGKGCTMPMFRRELVEQLVMGWIEKLKIDQLELEKAKVDAPSEKKKNDAEIRKLRADLAKIRERRKKWQRMFADDLIDEDELRAHNRDERANEEHVQAQLAELEALVEPVLSAPPAVMDMPALWAILDDLDRKELVQNTFNRIVVDTPLDRAHGKKGEFIPAEIKEVVFR